MTEKNALTPGETLMQEIGLALLKFTGYEIGSVNIVDGKSAETEDEAIPEKITEEPAEKPKRGRKPAPAKETPAESEDEPEDEPEDDDADEEDNTLTKADLEKKTVRQLRTIAINMGFDEEDVKSADKESLVESILDPVVDDEDDEDDDEVEADDSVDTDALVAKFEKLTLTALKKIAREEYEFKATDYKGMDKDAIIEMILEKADGSDVEDDDEDDDAPYTEVELNEMAMSELKAICKEWGLKIKIGEKKPAHVKAILDAQDD